MSFLKNNLKKIIAVLIGFFLVVLVVNGQIQAKKLADPNLFNPQKNTIYFPQIGDIKDQITLTGSIRATDVANLHFQTGGRLVWVGVKVGDRVKKWQALASLDREQLRKNLATQFNNYRTSLSQFTDTKNQYKDIIITDTIQRILDRTQYSLNNAVINYEITDMAIKDSVLTTPIEGVVTDISTPISGGFVTPIDTNFTVINPKTIYFRSEIDQDSVTKISQGQAATITLDSFPNTITNSKINFIAFTPVAGQSSTVYEVRFDLPLDNGQMTYRWGMDGNATIVLSEAKDALTIPTDTVNETNGQKYVQVKNGDILTKKNITTGIETDSTTQVLNGLTIYDQIVVKKK